METVDGLQQGVQMLLMFVWRLLRVVCSPRAGLTALRVHVIPIPLENELITFKVICHTCKLSWRNVIYNTSWFKKPQLFWVAWHEMLIEPLGTGGLCSFPLPSCPVGTTESVCPSGTVRWGTCCSRWKHGLQILRINSYSIIVCFQKHKCQRAGKLKISSYSQLLFKLVF